MFSGYSAYMPQFIIVRLIMIVFIALIIDLYFRHSLMLQFKKVRLALVGKGLPRLQIVLFAIFTLFVAGYLFFLFKPCDHEGAHHYFFLILTVFIQFYVPKVFVLFFQFIHDFISLVMLFYYKTTKKRLFSVYHEKLIFPKLGSWLGVAVFILVFFGIFFQKNTAVIENYNIKTVNIPDAFDDYKIIHISDIHFGSTRNKQFIETVIKKINALQPDLIVFTGDMINYHTYEVKDYVDLMAMLQAKDGKFAVLGNHDFGDYLYCYDSLKRRELVNQLVILQKEMGFTNLRDSSIVIKKGNDSILLTGIMNWSLPPYIKYGNPEKAINGFKDVNFKILLSHDPQHWQHQIKDSIQIDLTLSGHTHAMQMGIYTMFLKWSPAQWKYKYWGGIYTENNKYLIVNKGLGVIGFYGRIGIRPEIGLIILKSANEIHKKGF